MNNSLSSTKSQQSSLSELQTAITKFGVGYTSFLKKYPTLGKRTDCITTVRDAVCRKGDTLLQIDKKFANGASVWWIKYMLIEMFSFLGAIETVTTFQVKSIAERIRQEYYHFTPSELTYFFYSFQLGDYGKLYAGKTVNPQDIFIALASYARLVYQERAAAYKQQVEDEKKKQNADPNNISWEQYCKIRGINAKSSPLSHIQNDSQ